MRVQILSDECYPYFFQGPSNDPSETYEIPEKLWHDYLEAERQFAQLRIQVSQIIKAQEAQ